MTVQQAPQAFREGFQADERPKQAPPQQQVIPPEKKKLVLETPPPEIADSPAQEDEAAPPPAKVEEWPITVRLLHKPIKNDRLQEVNELVFREPRGGDINRFGNPVKINQEGEPIIEERKMHWMMAALSGLSPPRLDDMDPRDWNSCAYRLRSFFLPDPTAW